MRIPWERWRLARILCELATKVSERGKRTVIYEVRLGMNQNPKVQPVVLATQSTQGARFMVKRLGVDGSNDDIL